MEESRRQIQLHEEVAPYCDLRFSLDSSSLFHHRWNEKLMELLPSPEPGATVLDCGCGTGILLDDLISRYEHVYGMDLSLAMLKRIGPLTTQKISLLLAGDAGRLPFADEYFDAVISRGLLHHTPDRELALNEMNRVLKPRGVLVLAEPLNDSIIIRNIRKLMYRWSSRFDERDQGFLTAEITGLLEKADFKIQGIQHFGYFAYIFAGYPDVIPFLKVFPFRTTATEILLKIDDFISTLPFLRGHSLQIIVKAQKGGVED